ncbi:MAG: thioredoxin [Lacipirellulaceae bacterium]|uniref:thioredoxin n=1 Tax=Marinobacter salarius TaxID=1420917 RepID=UPI0032EEC80B
MNTGNTHTVTDASFESQVINAEKVVLVDFWAEWCGPCKAIAPVLEDIGEEYKGRLEVHKLDVDANPQTAGRYSIRSIPTMMLFKGGEVVETLVGIQPRAVLSHTIESHLSR